MRNWLVSPKEFAMDISLVPKVLFEDYGCAFEISGPIRPAYQPDAISRLTEAHRLWSNRWFFGASGYFHGVSGQLTAGEISNTWRGEYGMEWERKPGFFMRGYIPATTEEAVYDQNRQRLTSLANCLGTAVGRDKVYVSYLGRLVVLQVESPAASQMDGSVLSRLASTLRAKLFWRTNHD